MANEVINANLASSVLRILDGEGLPVRTALASAEPTLGRDAAEGWAESPVVPVWRMLENAAIAFRHLPADI